MSNPLSPPWTPVSDEEQKVSLRKELEGEVPKGHVLHKQKVEAVAKRDDDDDVLFKLDEDRYAIVHLTYNKETDPQWPHTTLCAWDEFLKAQHHF